jgi:hypothetical protein
MAYSQQRDTDPLIVYQFGLDVGGQVTGYFQEIGGINSESEVIEFKVSSEGKMNDARKNCSILLFDRNMNVAARWDFANAWPSKVSGPDIKADGNEYGIEEMTIVHEGMKRVKA